MILTFNARLRKNFNFYMQNSFIKCLVGHFILKELYNLTLTLGFESLLVLLFFYYLVYYLNFILYNWKI